MDLKIIEPIVFLRVCYVIFSRDLGRIEPVIKKNCRCWPSIHRLIVFVI